MTLLALPAFADNYIWLLHDEQDALVVDPGDSEPVERALDRLGLTLRGILVTHHHGDHTGGIDDLRHRLQGVVWGPGNEPIPQPVTAVQEGDTLHALGRRIQVLAVPGHTLGHVAYLVPGDERQSPLLFCGDTLFSAGCGRLFEGTPAQMFASLQRLAALPAATRVCCAHEYTLGNLRFAAMVEPTNPHVQALSQRCQLLLQQDQPTLPSTIAVELGVNPYLRCTEAEVIASALREGAENDSPVAVFAALRAWKNRTA